MPRSAPKNKPTALVRRNGKPATPASGWIAHVQAYRSAHGCSLKEAMQGASKTWKKALTAKSTQPKYKASFFRKKANPNIDKMAKLRNGYKTLGACINAVFTHMNVLEGFLNGSKTIKLLKDGTEVWITKYDMYCRGEETCNCSLHQDGHEMGTIDLSNLNNEQINAAILSFLKEKLKSRLDEPASDHLIVQTHILLRQLTFQDAVDIQNDIMENKADYLDN